MKSVDELKRVIIAVESENQASEKKLSDALARLETEKANCESAIENALRAKDMTAFLKFKSQLADINGRLDYYNGLKSLPAKSVDNYEKLLLDVYNETDQEYRAACRECIKKIDDLTVASDHAAAILREYADAMAFYKANVKTLSIMDGRIPDVYPNYIATRLTEKLQYQRSELEKYSMLV